MRALIWLSCAGALALAAGALPSLALFALAVGMVIMVLWAAVTVLAARSRLNATRLIAEREIGEDRPLRMRLDLGLPERLPVRVQVRITRRAWAELEPAGGVVEVPIGRRGAYRIQPTRLRISDALGIFRLTVEVGEREKVLVLPVPDGGGQPAPAPGRAIEHTEPDGLRPYVPGTPVSRIHWLSLARGMELHERRMGPPPSGLPLVVVDTHGAGEAEVDWVARAAAGLVRTLSRSGGCAVLLPGESAATPVEDEESWRALHRRLALLEAGDRPARPPAGAIVVRFPPDRTVDPPPPLPPGVVPLPAGKGRPR